MQSDDFGKRTEYPGTRPVVDDDRTGGRSFLGMLVALTLAIAVGILIWSFADRDRTASNTAPAVTTGSSSTTPSPSNPPPAKGTAESNSMR
jgi:hypothetical protein